MQSCWHTAKAGTQNLNGQSEQFHANWALRAIIWAHCAPPRRREFGIIWACESVTRVSESNWKRQTNTHTYRGRDRDASTARWDQHTHTNTHTHRICNKLESFCLALFVYCDYPPPPLSFVLLFIVYYVINFYIMLSCYIHIVFVFVLYS